MHAEISALGVETTLASSAAMLLVLCLRRPLRGVLGARAAYVLWACVPASLLAVLLPRGTGAATVLPMAWQAMPAAAAGGVPEVQGAWHWSATLVPLWLAGALGSSLLLAWQQRRFTLGLGVLQCRDDGLYQSRTTCAGLPAVAGAWRPRILLPADFERRYTERERELVIAHERLHVRRGDLFANGFAALLACLFWFNPLLHASLRRFRLDQELACDEQVIAHHPGARRDYGQAMLKTQFDPSPLPLGCHWQARHPIRERIDMLKRPTPSRLRWTLSTLAALGASAAVGYTAWAAQPASAGAEGARAPVAAPATGTGAFLLARQTRHDGVEGQGVLSQWVAPAEPAVSIVGAGEGRWKTTATVEPGAGPGTAVVRLRIERGEPGVTVAEPVLVVREGEAAAVEQRDGTGRLVYRTQVLVLPLQGSREATEARMHELLAAGATPRPYDWTALPPAHMPPPRYPREAADAHVSGKVTLVLDIAADGSVSGVEVESATPAGVFDAAAIEAAWQWKFKPAAADGQAVPGRVRVPVTFEASSDETAAAGQA